MIVHRDNLKLDWPWCVERDGAWSRVVLRDGVTRGDVWRGWSFFGVFSLMPLCMLVLFLPAESPDQDPVRAKAMGAILCLGMVGGAWGLSAFKWARFLEARKRQVEHAPVLIASDGETVQLPFYGLAVPRTAVVRVEDVPDVPKMSHAVADAMVRWAAPRVVRVVATVDGGERSLELGRFSSSRADIARDFAEAVRRVIAGGGGAAR